MPEDIAAGPILWGGFGERSFRITSVRRSHLPGSGSVGEQVRSLGWEGPCLIRRRRRPPNRALPTAAARGRRARRSLHLRQRADVSRLEPDGPRADRHRSGRHPAPPKTPGRVGPPALGPSADRLGCHRGRRELAAMACEPAGHAARRPLAAVADAPHPHDWHRRGRCHRRRAHGCREPLSLHGVHA